LPLRAARERWLEQLEREYVGGLLERHKGNVAQVAEAAGVDKSYIHRLIRRNGL
jgi:transcriptional regulator of acetoin/glycerol metabolism